MTPMIRNEYWRSNETGEQVTLLSVECVQDGTTCVVRFLDGWVDNIPSVDFCAGYTKEKE